MRVREARRAHVRDARPCFQTSKVQEQSVPIACLDDTYQNWLDGKSMSRVSKTIIQATTARVALICLNSFIIPALYSAFTGWPAFAPSNIHAPDRIRTQCVSKESTHCPLHFSSYLPALRRKRVDRVARVARVAQTRQAARTDHGFELLFRRSRLSTHVMAILHVPCTFVRLEARHPVCSTYSSSAIGWNPNQTAFANFRWTHLGSEVCSICPYGSMFHRHMTCLCTRAKCMERALHVRPRLIWGWLIGNDAILCTLGIAGTSLPVRSLSKETLFIMRAYMLASSTFRSSSPVRLPSCRSVQLKPRAKDRLVMGHEMVRGEADF
ncbi:hypothetical protein FVE85_1254 [Porphyridium purpureum]|uniref:Uncharacterized protein n=1 Tax=Porphyridium purpureum TaxID=35688 RepID=A0A5J4YJY7_PORPP|nr:hypothetical protein FVE85_1254 [Porphyridium purpureum]|eukprot:POR4068..scf251_18